VQVDEAHHLLVNAHPDFPRFYGPAAGLDWGVGLIARGLAYPFYDREISEFVVGVGRAYIVSHECDIDPANSRPFNDTLLVCPIIPLEVVLDNYLAGRSAGQTKSFVRALGNGTVDRAAYIPTIADELPYGGVLYLNAMTHTNVAELGRNGVVCCCAVSAFGLRYIDRALSNAILKRPKAQPLPLTGDLARWSTEAGPTVAVALKELGKAVLRRVW
jgi:hypothetical protein